MTLSETCPVKNYIVSQCTINRRKRPLTSKHQFSFSLMYPIHFIKCFRSKSTYFDSMVCINIAMKFFPLHFIGLKIGNFLVDELRVSGNCPTSKSFPFRSHPSQLEILLPGPEVSHKEISCSTYSTFKYFKSLRIISESKFDIPLFLKILLK